MSKLSMVFTIKLNQKQVDRLAELMQLTGFNRREIIRALIDNSELVMRPAPGATLTIDPPETS